MLDVDIGLERGSFSIAVRFAADAGVTVLFGRSGAGKTSVLYALAGLLKPQRGRIEVGGRALFDASRGVDVPPHRRRVGFVFQEARLLPHLSVRQNLLYGHRLIAPEQRRIGLARVVELLGIGELLGRGTAALSGGERQRVAIGRALLANPELLLMDEPLASLDNARRAEILQYIERLRDELRVPIVYVSHALEEVVRLADTLVLMERGAAIASGPAHEVLGMPELRSLGSGLEAGALIEARVEAYDPDYDLTTLEFAGGSLQAIGVDALLGERVRVRIRARDVAIALSPPADCSVLNVLPATIAGIEPQGEQVDVRLRVGESSIKARITRLSCERLGLHAGQRVYGLIKSVSLDRFSMGLK